MSCDDFLTADGCRLYFDTMIGDYSKVHRSDIYALQSFIQIEYCKAYNNVETPLFTVPRRKADSVVIKTTDDDKLIKAFLKVEYVGHWKAREAVSFNADGFIGFCGEIDSDSAQPVYRAFMYWVDDWMCRKFNYYYES